MDEYNHNPPSRVLIKSAEVAGEIVDILLADRILEIGPATSVVPSAPPDKVVSANGCLLLPGLTDHHLHLRSYAAIGGSVDVSPGAVMDLASLKDLVEAQPGEGWVRCIGYHESTLGELDRHSLAEVRRPLRIQHRSGKLWVLNDLALQMLGVDQAEDSGVERDATGAATGRLFRMDRWLAAQIGEATQSVAFLRAELAAYGITRVNDASHTNTVHDEQSLKQELSPLRVDCMGAATSNQLKVMLDEEALPKFEQLVSQITRAHAINRGVAFHCVSRIEILFAVAALKASGTIAQDRIEHGGLIPESLIDDLVVLQVPVVTQPGFIFAKGDQYLEDVPTNELVDLYRYGSLLAAGVRVVASSDAPYGPLNPWQIMATAVSRQTSSGNTIGANEAVTPEEAISGYLRHEPSSEEQKIVVGESANLCLLDCSWGTARKDLSCVTVAQTWIDGTPQLPG